MRPDKVFEELKIDKSGGIPVYRQLVHQVTSLVKEGKLKHGDKLPTERDLANHLGVARGTVSKAYEQLEQNQVVEITQGSGCFVSKVQDVHGEGRKERAVKVLEQAVYALEELKFSHREILALFQIVIMARERQFETFQIALVDCNPEALAIFESQLRYMSHNRIFTYLIEDIRRDRNLEAKLGEYDLILTTTSHYHELLATCPSLKRKLVQFAISPSQQTIIDLTSIPSDARLVLVGQSARFEDIARRRLDSFQLNTQDLLVLSEARPGDLAEQLKDRQVLILPRESKFDAQPEHLPHIQEFLRKGGRVIRLDYQIERGSLIHIEEVISELLHAEPAFAQPRNTGV